MSCFFFVSLFSDFLWILVWGFQSDSYQATGCYNLLCSGFVQINGQIALGATISPLSAYDDKQFDIDILIWKVNDNKKKAHLSFVLTIHLCVIYHHITNM